MFTPYTYLLHPDLIERGDIFVEEEVERKGYGQQELYLQQKGILCCFHSYCYQYGPDNNKLTFFCVVDKLL